MAYNAAFFGVHEAYFLVLKEKYGEGAALGIMKYVMERSLGKAYSAMGFEKGKPEDFVRVIEERDKSVGLAVKLIAERNKIIYRFHTDPFPGLKGRVNAAKLDATYMDFKIDFLLGTGWYYRTTKHIWNGDSFTEHVIEKN